jgi:hypothetical protein
VVQSVSRECWVCDRQGAEIPLGFAWFCSLNCRDDWMSWSKYRRDKWARARA